MTTTTFPNRTSGMARAVLTGLLALAVLAAALAAWQRPGAANADAGAPLDATQVRMAPGEEIALADGARVRFVAVVGDSRCPADAMCIVMGRAVLAFEIETPTGYTGNFLLEYEGPAAVARVWGYAIEVLDVQPYPLASQPTAAGDYRVAVNISQE